MKTLSTEITIDASPERVWAVLTDFAAYPEWNPFIVAIEGDVTVGSQLRVRLRPPGGRTVTMKPTVSAVSTNDVFEWLGSLPVPGLFSGRHRFELHGTADGTRFVQQETFTGVLVPLLGRLLRKTAVAFEAMNDALKARAESALVTGR